jgi:glucosamine-6-phosphate deaminase
MARKTSMLAPQWWDYTTLDDDILNEAAKLTVEDIAGLSREGFEVVFYDTLEDFYLAEALEYITAWRQATADNPTGICGPIGPTEQLPLAARIVNELKLNLKFLGNGRVVYERQRGAAVAPTVFRKGGYGALLQSN